MTTYAHSATPALTPSPATGGHRFPTAGPATGPALLKTKRLPAAGPAANLVALPDPTGLTPADPAEVDAHLARIETARLQQLDALPPTALDAVTAAHRDCLQHILDDVRTARARLAAGVYGVCAGCEEQIPAARLELRPWATTCAGCAPRGGPSMRGETR